MSGPKFDTPRLASPTFRCVRKLALIFYTFTLPGQNIVDSPHKWRFPHPPLETLAKFDLIVLASTCSGGDFSQLMLRLPASRGVADQRRFCLSGPSSCSRIIPRT